MKLAYPMEFDKSLGEAVQINPTVSGCDMHWDLKDILLRVAIRSSLT
jgi:hypothetical protein